jgi:hypothetical protein
MHPVARVSPSIGDNIKRLLVLYNSEGSYPSEDKIDLCLHEIRSGVIEMCLMQVRIGT